MHGFLQGKPQPQVVWTKNDQPLDTSRVNIRNTDKDTIFFIREAQRGDSGKYQLAVKINGAEDKAILDIRVIGMAMDGVPWACAVALGLISALWSGLAPGLVGWDRPSSKARGFGVLLICEGVAQVKAAGSLPVPAHHSFSSLMSCNRVRRH